MKTLLFIFLSAVFAYVLKETAFRWLFLACFILGAITELKNQVKFFHTTFK